VIEFCTKALARRKIEEKSAVTTNFGRESAKIYQFPVRRPPNTDAPRQKSKPATDLNPIQVSEVEFGSGWYHDAAIRDAERNRTI
jgi:hypothetical protein